MPQQSQPQRSGRQFQRASRETMDGMKGHVSEVGNGASEVVEQAARRFQDMSRETYRFAQDAMDLNMSAMNRIVGCRSIGELAEVQREYFKEMIDHAFDASTRVYGMGTDVAEDFSGSFAASIKDAAEETAHKREEAKDAAGGKR